MTSFSSYTHDQVQTETAYMPLGNVWNAHIPDVPSWASEPSAADVYLMMALESFGLTIRPDGNLELLHPIAVQEDDYAHISSAQGRYHDEGICQYPQRELVSDMVPPMPPVNGPPSGMAAAGRWVWVPASGQDESCSPVGGDIPPDYSNLSDPGWVGYGSCSHNGHLGGPMYTWDGTRNILAQSVAPLDLARSHGDWLDGGPSHGLATSHQISQYHSIGMEMPVIGSSTPYDAANMTFASLAGHLPGVNTPPAQMPLMTQVSVVPAQCSAPEQAPAKSKPRKRRSQKASRSLGKHPSQKPAPIKRRKRKTAALVDPDFPLPASDLSSLVERLRFGRWCRPCEFVRINGDSCIYPTMKEENGNSSNKDCSDCQYECCEEEGAHSDDDPFAGRTVVRIEKHDEHFIVSHVLAEAKLWKKAEFKQEKLQPRACWVLPNSDMAKIAAEYLLPCPLRRGKCKKKVKVYTRVDLLRRHVSEHHSDDVDYDSVYQKLSKRRDCCDEEDSQEYHKEYMVLMERLVEHLGLER